MVGHLNSWTEFLRKGRVRVRDLNRFHALAKKALVKFLDHQNSAADISLMMLALAVVLKIDLNTFPL